MYLNAKYKKAIIYYSEAIELDPNDVLLHARRGDAYLKIGKIEEAFRDYSKAIELDPNIAFFHARRGKSLSSNWENRRSNRRTTTRRLNWIRMMHSFTQVEAKHI